MLKKLLSDKAMRHRLLITLGLLCIYRLGIHLRVPGVAPEDIQQLQNIGALGYLDTLTGGGLTRYSLFALGVSPYITASIIMQLLQMDLIPSFTEWAKQGHTGRQKLNQWTKYFATFFAITQGTALVYGLRYLSITAQEALAKETGVVKEVLHYGGHNQQLLAIFTLVVGSLITIWIADQITQYGLGNGTSLIIFTGILSQLPKELYSLTQKSFNWTYLIAIPLFLIGVYIIIKIDRSEYRIPIYYAKRYRKEAERSYFPLKLNSAGVIPVIFASSVMMLPETFASLLNVHRPWLQFLSLQSYTGILLYAVLIMLFTFFYAHIQINPEEAAKQLEQQGGYIPTIRPGKDTESYLKRKINSLSLPGGLFLTLIAVIPMLVSKWAPGLNFALAGTSLLIVISVALETTEQIRGKLMKHDYQDLSREVT